MPRRQRRSKARVHELTPAQHLALVLGPGPLDPTTDDELVELYALHRDELVADARPGTWPWAAWAFEPDVPDELQAIRRPLIEVPEDAPVPVQAPDAALEVRRARWLGAVAAEVPERYVDAAAIDDGPR